MKTNGKLDLQSQQRIEMAVNEQREKARLLCEAQGWKFYPVLKKHNFIGYCLTPQGIIPIELKVRSGNNDTWPSILIEQKMVNSLTKRAKSLGYKRCFYAEYYQGDNSFLYFELSSAPFEWVLEECNSNTLDRGKKTKKSVSFLDKSFATLVELQPKLQPELQVNIEKGINYPNSYQLF